MARRTIIQYENKEETSFLWFDPNIDSCDDTENTKTQQRLINSYVIFHSELEESIACIKSTENEKIFLITSESCASQFLSRLVILRQIDSIFIYYKILKMIRSTDYSYMNEDSINALLKCQLCSKPFVDPVITTNGDRLCRSCTISDNDHSSFVPVNEKLLLDLLDDLRVECIKCKEINIRRGDLEQHNKMTCPERIVLCKAVDLKCLWTGSYEELNPHLQSCTFELLRPIFTEILADIKQFKEQKSYDELKQCSTLTIEYDEFKKEVEEFRQERTRFQTEIQQLKNQNEQVERLLEEEIIRTNELENQLEQLKQLYNRQINQNNELQTEIQQLKEQFIQQNTLYNEFQIEFNQYKQIKQLFNQNHEIQQLKEQYNQQMNQYEQLSKHVRNHNTQSQKDEIIYIKQLVNQHDIQIKLLARKKCVIPAVTLYTDIKLEQFIEEAITNSEIDLDGKQLIDHDMDVVYKKAILEKKCTKLRLQKNKITGKGATILANALYNNTTLTELYLSKNQISDIGVHSLAQTLSINNFTLTLLDLHSNNITDEGAEYLAEMLKINKTIIRLGLGFNQISDQGVRLLANTITYYNENLQWLSLSSNRLISDESLPSLIEMLTYNPSLKTLWLNDCNLSTNAAARLKQKVATNENFILEV